MSATNEMAPPDARTAVAARAFGLSKVYGEGDAAVRALDDVSVEFERARYTAIMGPSGLGEVDAAPLHGRPRHADLRPGVHRRRRPHDAVGEGADAAAPEERRVRLPGVQPGADAHRRREHHAPAGHRGRRARPEPGSTSWWTPWGSGIGCPTGRRSSRAGSSSGSPGRARSSPAPRSSSRTSRRATWTRRSGHEILEFLRSAVKDHGQTIVMVTHDASAASFADRIVFLGDGKVVDEMLEPTTERILDRLKSLEG